MQQALGKEQRPPDSPYALLEETLSQIEEKASAVRTKCAERAQELLQGLADVSQQRGWKVHRASNAEEGLDYICDLAELTRTDLGPGPLGVVRSDQEVFQTLEVNSPLSSMGVEVTVMTRSSGLSNEEARRQAAQAGIGITGADYAIAETGTVVLMPRQGLSRLVSLLPPIHVALVRPQEVVESLEDLFILRRLAYYQGDRDMGPYMNFITGPSRTADIEQTLVIGVHGPKEAHLVLLE